MFYLCAFSFDFLSNIMGLGCISSISALFVPQNTEKMKAFFEAIAYLQEILFIPLNLLRGSNLQLVFGQWHQLYSWDWVCRNDLLDSKLKKFNDSGEEDTDSTSHSFL